MRAILIGSIVLFISACDETTSIDRTLTFEGALSESCLLQAVAAGGFEVSSSTFDGPLIREQFQFRIFKPSSELENNSGSSFYWRVGDVQSLIATYFTIGPSNRDKVDGFCETTTAFFPLVVTECMLNPETTDLTDINEGASC